MRRWETLAALAAVVVASLGALPFPGHALCTFAGIALILLVGVSRLLASLVRRAPPASDAAERAARIREQRHRRG